ncbi:hypothetical protein, partial [Mycobacterium sp.]
LKAVHSMIKAIPTDFQYFPLARDQRAHYRRTGTVAPIPLPETRINETLAASVGRTVGNGSRDRSKTERADLMAKSAPGDEVSVQ